VKATDYPEKFKEVFPEYKILELRDGKEINLSTYKF